LSRNPRLLLCEACAALGFIGFAPIVFAALIGDWWGLVNGTVLAIFVFVCKIDLSQNRRVFDLSARAGNIAPEFVKAIVTISDGKAITMLVTRDILIECILITPKPFLPKLYDATRVIGWLAFGIHVITFGMASLIC
jgi:hypothetical protein